MAQQTLNNGVSGQVFREICNSNFTELYNTKAPNNHASTSTTYGVASNTNYGHIKVTSGNGLSLSNGTLVLNGASTTDATTGTATNLVMSPARVKEAVNAYGVMSDGNLIFKVGTEQPTPQSGKTIIWINTSELS